MQLQQEQQAHEALFQGGDDDAWELLQACVPGARAPMRSCMHALLRAVPACWCLRPPLARRLLAWARAAALPRLSPQIPRATS